MQRAKWQAEDSSDEIRKKVLQTISDVHGWDVLFFCGHSQETMATGGKFSLTPSISLSVSDIEDKLEKAQKNGLKLAVFNSCYGLSLANALINLGLQVVAMREPIHNHSAHQFLQQFCKHFAAYRNAQDALTLACEHLQVAEKISHPSVYLIPSFFSPPNTTPVRLKPFNWQQRIKQWLPHKREAIVLGVLLSLSLMLPVQDLLLDLRHFAQTVYRQLISPAFSIGEKTSVETTEPPVLLVKIDERSINDLAARGMRVDPIDRGYLADLINKLAEFKTPVIGIEYLLDRRGSGEDKFKQTLKNVVTKQRSWFVFQVDQNWNYPPQILNQNWYLLGHNSLYRWNLDLPEDPACGKRCSFAYTLFLAYQLAKNQEGDALQPDVNSNFPLAQTMRQYLKNNEQDYMHQSHSLISSEVKKIIGNKNNS